MLLGRAKWFYSQLPNNAILVQLQWHLLLIHGCEDSMKSQN